ncbi:MAG: hypothetical protein ACI4JC_08075 [Faecalibacterium sp.]
MLMENEKVLLNDDELEMVIGGVSKTFLVRREDGKIDVYTVSGSGDIETLRKLLQGGDASKIKASAGVRMSFGVKPDKLDALLARIKMKNPDTTFEWIS